MLENAYFLAKIGADTAENEQHLAEIAPIGRRVAARRDLCFRAAAAARRKHQTSAALWQLQKRISLEYNYQHTSKWTVWTKCDF